MTAAAARKTAHFVIDGEYLTGLVRDRVREGRWDWSWKLLMEDLHGMTAEIALRILKGDAKLTGRSDDADGIELADDDDQEYKAQLAWQFAGTFVLSDGRRMRPYAVVSSWGPEDYNCENRERTAGSDPAYGRKASDKGKDYSYRSLFYADDRQRDVLRYLRLPLDLELRYGQVFTGEQNAILFKEVRNFPAILFTDERTNDAQASLDAFLESGGRLDQTGYSHVFPPQDYKYTEPTPQDVAPAMPRSVYEINSVEDVEAVAALQKKEREEGREAAAREIAAVLTETCKTIGDHDRPMAARLAAWRQYEHQHRLIMDYIPDYRKRINAQAGDDVFDLTVAGKVHKVPVAPFERWALNSTDWFHLGPAWEPVCPQGLKLQGDDPFHSDWILGGGFALDEWDYSGDLYQAASKASHAVQQKYFNAEVPVLSGSGRVQGRVVHIKPGETLDGRGEIAVIRNAGPDYVQVAEEVIRIGGAIITETGGAMAHLVTVFRPQDLRIVRVEKARKLYLPGKLVDVDCTNGIVKAVQDPEGPIRLANGMILDPKALDDG